MGTALADWMINKVGADSNATIIQQNFPAEFIVARNLAMEAAIAKTTITIAGMFDADPANLIAGTKDATTAQLNALPDAKALWIPFSSSDAGASQALEAKFPGKSYPDRPLLLGVYASLPTLELIRQGKIDASVENALEWCSWVALDQIAQNSARGSSFSQDSDPSYGADLDWGSPVVVTSANLPPEGQLVPAPADFVSYFTSKWGAEFTNLG
jgi:ABC-type sugar transport system substrate-binding protein